MIITLTGLPGTNTSNICKVLALQLGLKYITGEKIRESIAKEYNISVEELETKISKEVFATKVNEFLKKQAPSKVITDYSLASWLVNEADLRVFLQSRESERVKRLVKNMEIPFIMAKKMVNKEEDERKKKYLYDYGINIYDVENFDILINVDKLNEDGIIAIIRKYLEKMKKWQ